MTTTPQTHRTFIGPEGEERRWHLLPSRLQKFREMFPANEGWKLQVSARHELDLAPKLLEALTAFSKGLGDKLPPDQYGRTAIPAYSYVFTAEIVDKDDKVVDRGSSRWDVRAAKDWEMGESAAISRVLRNIGIPGEVGDDDAQSPSAPLAGDDLPPLSGGESGGPGPASPAPAPTGAAGEPQTSAEHRSEALETSIGHLARQVQEEIDARFVVDPWKTPEEGRRIYQQLADRLRVHRAGQGADPAATPVQPTSPAVLVSTVNPPAAQGGGSAAL